MTPRKETYICLRELREQLLLVRECLLRLPRADHPVNQPREVLLQPLQAPLQFSLLARGDKDQPVSQVLERDEPVVRSLDWRRAVEVVGLPELFHLAHRLIRVPPVRVLQNVERLSLWAGNVTRW